MEIRILGPFETHVAGHDLGLGGKPRTLLALLTVREGRVVPHDVITDALWAGRPPARARNQIQVYVSALRRRFVEAGRADPPIHTRPGGYLLSLEPGTLDLHHFHRWVAWAERRLSRHDLTGAAEGFRQALGLWRGTPLADVEARFAELEALRLEALRLSVLEHRLDLDLALGHHPGLVPELLDLVATEPLHEGHHGRLMLTLHLTGRTAEALAVYRRARRTLVSELGIEPGSRLRELHRMILRGRDRWEIAAFWLRERPWTGPGMMPDSWRSWELAPVRRMIN